jgi:DegV family protein with EDD domain
MERIALVTDSSCDASDAELAEMGIACIHLKVVKPDGSFFPEDNTVENIEAYYDYLATCDDLPGTSMPSPLDFADKYTELALEGYTHIISMHIAAGMSGTVNAARMAAESAPITVEVIDTHCNTVGQYLFVRRMAQLRSAGLGFDQLVETAHSLEGKTSVCFMLDTLKNLVKGGRTGRATGLAASLLNIKPLLTVDPSGIVEMWGKAKSPKRAVPKLVDHFKLLEGEFGPLEYCLVHTRNLPGVDALRTAMLDAGIMAREVGVRQAGPVIATHVSTGCFGFAYIPIDERVPGCA